MPLRQLGGQGCGKQLTLLLSTRLIDGYRDNRIIGRSLPIVDGIIFLSHVGCGPTPSHGLALSSGLARAPPSGTRSCHCPYRLRYPYHDRRAICRT